MRPRSSARDGRDDRAGDLLNVNLGGVLPDADTFLRYADGYMFVVVILFNRRRTPEGETAMEAMPRDVIQAALRLGARYCLPYRLHATREQFQSAYPQASRFFELKKRYDPELTFQDLFYRRLLSLPMTDPSSRSHG